MDTLAPATLVFRRRATLERLVLDAGLEIGAGGEAVVYEVPGDPALVAKVYHQPTIERARKLTLMLANPPRMPAGTSIAWPADLLLGASGFAGFVMPRAEGPRLFEFYNPVTRRATAAAFHFGMLHRAGRNLAAAFHALHAAGYVVGDVNESNILVHPASASVTLVDADSFQVPDADAGTVFRSRVGKAEFTPPELQGVSFTDVDRAPEHDRFGLAVLLFLALMEGTHPFAVRMQPGADALPVEERIRRGLFPHALEDDDCHPPRLSPPFGALHPELRALFVRAFVEGHADPGARPTAAEWCQALEAAEAALGECGSNALHRHAPHLEACPWCERTALLGGRDPFPAGALQPSPRAPQRPRRVRVPPTPFGAAPPTTPAAAAQNSGTPPFQGVSVLRSGSSTPAVFGRSGLRNPLVFATSGFAVMVVASGPVAVLGFVTAVCGALLLLVLDAWRDIRASTVAFAICAAFFVGSVVGLGFDDDDEYWDGPGGSLPAYVDEPVANIPEVVEDIPGPPPAAWTEAPRLDELRSASVGEGGTDPGPPPASGVDSTVVDDPTVLPVLANPREAANALAFLSDPTSGENESALLWLRVGADGRITVNGAQLVRSSSTGAGQAALLATAYFRYLPAQKRGENVGVWVTQPVVFVP
jgi:hypothetical protein